SEAAIRLGKPPEWGETYTLIVRKGISAVRGGKTAEDLAYALVFDAPESRPPRFLRGFFQDTAQVLSQDTDFGCISLAAEKFPSTDPATTKPAELCLVFAISGAASSITPSSAMAAFAISPSNGCARFSIKTLKVLDEAGYRADTFNDPSLAAEAGEKLYALVYGLEVENTKDPGLVVFSIAPSIEDSLGNTLGKGVTITWNKQQ
ncbi:MAG: hypothetical protein LBO76_00835, partial [Treponema sp.]|nr:hypothetical protein [Treponema sp.]